LGVTRVGIEAARPAPGVVEALRTADLVLVGPSNPVVSIGPILAVPGIRAALRTAPAPVVGFSGILRGAPVLGMAHRLLPAIGVAVDAAAVGRHYGSRGGEGVLDAWVLDTGDAASIPALEAEGLIARVDDLVMSSPDATAAFVRRAVEAVEAVAR
jgi:LPPG:FO 2-phospho-L-lactate transferase